MNGFFFHENKKKILKKKTKYVHQTYLAIFFTTFFFFRWKINPSMFMGHVRIFTLHWFSCSHKGLTISVQELLSSAAKVKDSTFKSQVQMVLFNGQWFAVSDPQSKLISSSLPGKDRRHSYSGLSSTLLVEPFSLRLRFNGSHETIQGPWFKFKSTS